MQQESVTLAGDRDPAIDVPRPPLASVREAATAARRVRSYFGRSLRDYTHGWHSDHMHYGYCRTVRQIADFGDMLTEMCRQVAQRLKLEEDDRPYSVLDIGCGVMGTSRFVASSFRRTRLYSLNLVPSYLHYGSRRNTAAGLDRRIHPLVADFDQALPFAEGSFDAAYAIEALVHASDKSRTLQEIGRLLKPGGRLVIADGFRTREFGLSVRAVHRSWSRAFAASLAPIGEVTGTLAQSGFDVVAERIDWRVAPSMAHLPLKILGYTRSRYRDVNWSNLVGILAGAALGATAACGYYLVTATRR